ncbi:MAG: HAMP domain-containing histidine kinase [Desulfofustis sp.]|nr:HAMP domain-containing histidine kinase [Desulfofustis sp.]
MGTSLQKKFILVAFLAIFAITAAISLLTAVKTRSALYKASEQQGRMLAETVSALIINELIYEKLGLVEEGGLIDNYMRDLEQHNELNINSVAVLDDSYRVISHSDFREYGKNYDNQFLRSALNSGTLQVRSLPANAIRVDALEFAAPLSIEGKNWGVLLFTLSMSHVQEEIIEMIVQIVLNSILVLAVLYILIYLLSRRFIKPIIDLSQAMEEVEVEMSEKTVPVKGNDELATLTRSFNEMVQRIRNANEEMKLANEKLLQSEKLATLGVLSSSVAHRINNPLGGLFNCVGLMRKKGEEEEFRKNYLDLIEEGLESIKQTVGQLLWTAGRREGEDKQSEVSAALPSVLRYLDYRIKKQGITYSQEIESDLSLPVAPHDLEELLLNIMLNAVQAMESGGQLKVMAHRSESQVVIIVEDTGTGIPEDNIDDVFKLFYTTKDADEGTGLGMWISYELVKKHKGEIFISSQVGNGTKITIVLPEAK